MSDNAASLCLGYPKIPEVSTIKRYLIVRLRDICAEEELGAEQLSGNSGWFDPRDGDRYPEGVVWGGWGEL
jgi:hypothetical protein